MSSINLKALTMTPRGLLSARRWGYISRSPTPKSRKYPNLQAQGQAGFYRQNETGPKQQPQQAQALIHEEKRLADDIEGNYSVPLFTCEKMQE